MKNKNKNTEFIYFQKFSSQDFWHVEGERLTEKEKKEGKKVDSIDKKQLTQKTNGTLSKYRSRLKALPIDLQTAIRTHINQYFYDSYSQYDDNSKKGLNQKEFQSYGSSINSKLGEILDKYAPSKEAVESQQNSEKKAEQMSAKEVKKMEELSRAAFEPSLLGNPEGIQSEWQKVVAKSQAVGKQYELSMKLTEGFFRDYKEWEESKTEIGAAISVVQNGLSWLTGGAVPEDPGRKKMKKQKKSHKKRLREDQESVQKQNKEIDDYSGRINTANDEVKNKIIDTKRSTEENLELTKQATADGTQEREKADERNKEFIEYRVKLAGNLSLLRDAKQGFLDDQENLTTQEIDRKDDIKVKEDKLAKSSLGMTKGLKILNKALKNPNLPKDKKKILESKKKELLKSLKAVDSGFNTVEEGKLESETYFEEKTTEIESKLNSNDSSTVNYRTSLGSTDAGIDALTESIATLDTFLLENGTKTDQLTLELTKIDEGIESFDKMDKQIADQTLDINIVGSKMLIDLGSQYENVKKITISGPNLWDATVGTLANYLGKGLKGICDGCSWAFGKAGDFAEWLDIPILSDMTAFSMDVTSGLFTGLGEMIGGLEMLLKHPIDTISALGQLMPWNEGWTEKWAMMGSAIVGGEYWVKGEHGKGLGVAIINILSMFIGVGAVSKAGLAAKVIVQGASQAGKTGMILKLMYVGAFIRAFPGNLARGIGQTLKGIVKFPGKLATKGVVAVENFRAGLTASQKVANQVDGAAAQVATTTEKVADIASDVASKMHDQFKGIKNLDDAKHTKNMSAEELAAFQKYKAKNRHVDPSKRQAAGLHDELAGYSVDDLVNGMKKDGPIDLESLGLKNTHADSMKVVDYIVQRKELSSLEAGLAKLKNKQAAIAINPKFEALFSFYGGLRFRGPKGASRFKNFIDDFNKTAKPVKSDDMYKVLQQSDQGVLAVNAEGKLQLFSSVDDVSLYKSLHNSGVSKLDIDEIAKLDSKLKPYKDAATDITRIESDTAKLIEIEMKAAQKAAEKASKTPLDEMQKLELITEIEVRLGKQGQKQIDKVIKRTNKKTGEKGLDKTFIKKEGAKLTQEKIALIETKIMENLYKVSSKAEIAKISTQTGLKVERIQFILKKNPEFLSPYYLNKNPKKLAQLIKSQDKIDNLASKLSSTPIDNLDDFIRQYNSKLESGALKSQEFQVVKSLDDRLVIVDETGKLKIQKLNQGNAQTVLDNLKVLDAKIQGRSYKLRQECLKRSNGEVMAHDAYTYGKAPKGQIMVDHAYIKKAVEAAPAENRAALRQRLEAHNNGRPADKLDLYLDDPKNWLPERRIAHDKLINTQFAEAIKLSRRLGDDIPTIYALRGNTAAGKTTRLKNDPAFKKAANEHGDVTGAINPDSYKGTLRDLDATGVGASRSKPRAWQTHEEGSMLARRLSGKIENAKPPISDLSMIIDKRLNKPKNIDDLFAKGERLNRPIKIMDVDAPLETSAQRVLQRSILGDDPVVTFSAVAGGYKGIRANRRALIERVKNDPMIKEYVLYVTDEAGNAVKVADKVDGKWTTYNKKLYDQSIVADKTILKAEVDRVANTRITDNYIDKVVAAERPEYRAAVRESLERYKGKTLEEALDAHSKLTREPISFDTYAAQSTANLKSTSRAANGKIDVSASKDKAAKMAEQVSPEETARLVVDNYEGVMRNLHSQRHRQFESPAELRAFVEQIGADVNKGITKEGVLIRKGADSTKYPYTRTADLESAMTQFYDELHQRLKNPKQDPVELAAWIEYRVNFTDHFFADGCGKSSQALSNFVFMRNNMPLPRLASKKEIVKLAAKTDRTPSAVFRIGDDIYTPKGTLKDGVPEYNVVAAAEYKGPFVQQADHVTTLDELARLYRSRLGVEKGRVIAINQGVVSEKLATAI